MISQGYLSQTENTRDRSHVRAVCACEPILTITMSVSASSPAYSHTCMHTLLCLFVLLQHNDSRSLSSTKDYCSSFTSPEYQFWPLQHDFVIYGTRRFVRACVRSFVCVIERERECDEW